MLENDRIREVRANLGLTMAEFGSRIGVSKQTISNIENGNRQPTEHIIKSIIREFHVRPEWLRDGDGEMFDKQSSLLEKLQQEYNLTDLESAIIADFIQMNPKARKAALEYGRDLLRKAEKRLAGEEEPAYVYGTPEGVAASEAAYEKCFGIAPLPESTASSTTDEEQRA